MQWLHLPSATCTDTVSTLLQCGEAQQESLRCKSWVRLNVHVHLHLVKMDMQYIFKACKKDLPFCHMGSILGTSRGRSRSTKVHQPRLWRSRSTALREPAGDGLAQLMKTGVASCLIKPQRSIPHRWLSCQKDPYRLIAQGIERWRCSPRHLLEEFPV